MKSGEDGCLDAAGTKALPAIPIHGNDSSLRTALDN